MVLGFPVNSGTLLCSFLVSREIIQLTAVGASASNMRCHFMIVHSWMEFSFLGYLMVGNKNEICVTLHLLELRKVAF